MDDKANPASVTPQIRPMSQRFVIVTKTQEYHDALDKLYKAKLSRAQVHSILNITQGDVIGLKWAAHEGTLNIWFVYKGHRYDLKKDGSIMADVKAGKPSPAASSTAKAVKCKLCGTGSPVPRYDVDVRCPVCGFPLVRFQVVQRK